MNRCMLACGAVFFVCVSTTQSVGAQTKLYELHGNTKYGAFGASICSLGDLDGDGVADLAVGAPIDSTGGSLAGSVRIVSGRTGATLHSLIGQPNTTFGSVADAGDIDGDGLDDLIVGATYATGLYGGPGAAKVFSSSSWSTIYSWGPDYTIGGKSFGLVLSGQVDFDGDGKPEIVVGDPDWDWDKISGAVGRVYVYSGANGALLHSLLPPTDPITGQLPRVSFGRSLSAIPDLDGDGHPDLLVGNGNTHRAFVVSVATGAVLRTYTSTDAYYGSAVLDVGDIDGDGVDDHLIGSPESVDLFSGATGTLIRKFAFPPQQFVDAPTLAKIGDVDFDGVPDYAIGFTIDDTVGTDAGSVTWISGATGATLLTMYGNSAGDGLGGALANVGDVDGDGTPDLAVGAGNDNDGGGTHSGSLYIVSMHAPTTASYCTAKTNSLGCAPFVDSSGFPSLTNALPFVIRAHDAINSKNGILFFGSHATANLFQGGTLCVQPPIQRTPPSSSGGDSNANNCSGTYAVDFGALIQAGTNPNLSLGASVYCQFWTRDPGASFGTGLSNALSFTILP